MRRKVTVIGAGNVGATCAQEIARRDYADVVLVDIIPNFPQGKALDMNQAAAVLSYEPNITGTNDYEETDGLGRDRGHGRQAARARHEPRRPRDDERGDRRRGHEGRGQALAEGDRRRRLEPARRDVPRREGGLEAPARARRRHGRHPRHRPLPRVHRLGDGGVDQGRADDGARRPRRPDGAGRLGNDRRRRAAHGARLEGADREDGAADTRRRRRDRQPPRHVRVVRARRCGGADGRRDPARREAHPPVHGAARGRVRDRRPVHGRAGEARRGRNRGDRRSSACLRTRRRR